MLTRTIMMMRKLTLSAFLLLAASTAFAGRGATYGSVMDAIATGNADVIASELERGEFLTCAACAGPVLDLLDNSDYRIREVAAWWLARRPVLAAAATMQSIARIQGNDARAAEYAADVIGTFRRPNTLPVLAAGLARTDFPGTTKAALVRAVGTIGVPDGMPIVVNALADSAAETRAEAVRAYDSIRGVHSGNELAGLLADTDVGVRRQAAASIGAYKVSSARTALENLMLHDSDPLVRRNAAYAIFKLGGAASRAALQEVMANDPVNYVRSTAKVALSGAN
jgi:HEAT repeat protein